MYIDNIYAYVLYIIYFSFVTKLGDDSFCSLPMCSDMFLLNSLFTRQETHTLPDRYLLPCPVIPRASSETRQRSSHGGRFVTSATKQQSPRQYFSPRLPSLLKCWNRTDNRGCGWGVGGGGRRMGGSWPFLRGSSWDGRVQDKRGPGDTQRPHKEK